MIPVRLLSPKGGFLVHAVDGYRALCGYAPGAPNRYLMKDRSGWRYSRNHEVTCGKCLKKFDHKIHEVI